MSKLLVVLAGALFPQFGWACESADRQTCIEQFRALVSYRMEAIEAAFGDFFTVMPAQIKVRFVGARDQENDVLRGREAYDPEQHALLFPKRVLGAKTPNPLRWAGYYWPYYQQERHQAEFPIIASIDTLLWNAYLQEAAQARGLAWPHQECVSTQVAQRLPCEMLIKGIAEHVKASRAPMFNENRIDRIWPEDFAAFERRAWRRTDSEYLAVQRYGGILLAEPLVSEFGVLRAIVYMAQTPFRIEENNLRASALRYQRRARAELGAQNVPHPTINAGLLSVPSGAAE